MKQDSVLSLLDDKTQKTLNSLAAQEYRNPRTQAAVLIRDSLARMGLLTPDPTPPTTQQKTTEAAQCSQ